jgi:hypothetical protein
MILLLLLAILGFCASAVVHGSSFLDPMPVGMDRAWPLHIGIFLVFIPMLLMQRRRSGTARPRSLPEAFPHAPRWMVLAVGALGAYAVVNFVAGMLLLGAFSGEKIVDQNGQHVALRNRAVARTVGEAEYQQHQAREVRLFSGHWMLFYWVAAVGIADGLRRRKAEPGPPPARPSPQMLPAGDRRGYTLAPPPRLRPWTHATLLVLVRIVGFFGCAIAVAFCTVPFANSDEPGPLKHLGCVGFLLFLPAAFFGAVVPARWVARRLPARCPFCDGRAYCDGANAGRGMYDFTYACRDCGAAFGPDGSRG